MCMCGRVCVCNSTENGLKGFTPNRGYTLGRNCGLMCVGWRGREGKGNFKERFSLSTPQTSTSFKYIIYKTSVLYGK